jgi:HEAT repeat protein
MSIRTSSSKQIDALVADLAGLDPIKRDAAVARLTVIGARAVARLIELAESPVDPSARAAAFRALEAIGDRRALEPALRILNQPDLTVARAAAGVVRVFVKTAKGAVAVEGLTLVALDRTRPEELRVAAVRALHDLDPLTIAPLVKSLSDDPSDAVRTEAKTSRTARPRSSEDPARTLAGMAERDQADDPELIRDLIARGGSGTPPSALLRIVVQARSQESVGGGRRADWLAARAAAHQALARRGSRVALYDLRESLETASGPLPVEMLSALSEVGDAACLEPIAAAHGRSKDRWWRDHLLAAFQIIARREHLTARHAIIKRIQKRWPRLLSKP